MLTEQEKQRILRIQAGDRDELERFLTDKKQLVILAARRYFLRGGDEDDLVQEATIGLVSAAMTFRAEENDSFDGYAYTIMQRKLINAVKGYNRKKHHALSDSASLTKVTEEGEYEVDLRAAEEDPIDRYLLEEDNLSFYRAAKQVLTDVEYRVLKAYLQGYTYREIAKAERVTEKKVDNIIFQIKKKIKRAKDLFLEDTENGI